MYIPGGGGVNVFFCLGHVTVNENIKLLFQISLHTPDFRVVKAIQKISWTAAGGMMDLLRASPDEIHKSFEKVLEKVALS